MLRNVNNGFPPNLNTFVPSMKYLRGMEFVTLKRSRNRRRRGHLKKRRRNQVKLEVNFTKRQRLISEPINKFNVRGKAVSNIMEASSFWENYSAAQEWQKRHNVTWWRTRCFALEYENQMLREKLRSLACQNTQQSFASTQNNQVYGNQAAEEEEDEPGSHEESENLEFHVNEDMMSFLEQSIRHKIELKKKQEAESLGKEGEKEENEDACIQGGAKWMQTRNKNAKLLYGNASPTILAMETALQASVDRHKDKAKPQYWPIIPLKP
ncbi:uncharacterized protein LOC143182320 [Calliopsis andreniformis]|uniref:uncharacterized protein LOC143182320 n=1 Tax=Calliopsis andreniformis TaxID=337506 RepID=UPI003FCC9907